MAHPRLLRSGRFALTPKSVTSVNSQPKRLVPPNAAATSSDGSFRPTSNAYRGRAAPYIADILSVLPELDTRDDAGGSAAGDVITRQDLKNFACRPWHM